MTAVAPERLLVLVVDDVADNRDMYADYLRSAGFRVMTALDGLDAIAQARSMQPDIIAMDMTLPTVDGWEATARLKSDDTTRSIPIIALTGHNDTSCRARAKRLGCDSFLTKPCLPSRLADEVVACLARRKRRGRGASIP
jgi:CheY-like chemotaxis protein